MEVFTGLYSKKANDILNSVIGQWSDGMYENSHSMEKYWRHSQIKSAEDGEIIINVDLDYGSGFAHMSEFEVKAHFAKYIKTIAKQEMADNGWGNCWSRSDEHESHYLNYSEVITIADAYFVYETLKGRSRANVKYDKNLVEAVIGKPLTPEVIALNKEIALVKNEYNKTCQLIRDQKKSRIEEIEAYTKACLDKTTIEYGQKISSLEKKLKAIA